MASHSSARPSELAMPVASLAAMRNALVEAVGDDTAAYALRQAGYAAGDAFVRILAGPGTDGPGAVPADRFWADLARLFANRGWGQISFSRVHEGVGAIEAADWAEARPVVSENATGDEADAGAATGQPACHFTTGLLANVLGQAADSEIAVLEVECRARGDDRCRFLFGGSEAVYRVYDRIAEGERPDAVLAGLR
jgi:predicted hydrocarbon binding protein